MSKRGMYDDELAALFEDLATEPAADQELAPETVSNAAKPTTRKKKKKRKRPRADASSSASSTAPTEAAATPLSPSEIAEIETLTASANGRKSKYRKPTPRVDPPSAQSAASDVSTSDVRGVQRLASMPRMEDLWRADEWTGRLNAPAPYISPPSTVVRSAAEALLETIRMETEQKRIRGAAATAKAAAAAAVSAAAAAAGKEEEEDGVATTPAVGIGIGTHDDDPPSQAATTIRKFFERDFQTPLTGLAADAHELFERVRREISARDKDLKSVMSSASQPAPAAARRRAIKDAMPSSREDGTDDTDDVECLAEDSSGASASYARLEKCGRAFCGDFLREAREEKYGERPCVRGNNCVFMVISGNYPESVSDTVNEERFVCREFMRPSEVLEWKDSGAFPELRRTCLGCNRLITSLAYFSCKSRGEQPSYLLQDHYNDVDNDMDGYDQSHCLTPVTDAGEWSGIAMPIVEFEPMRLVPTTFELRAESTKQRWLLKGVVESQADFRISPSSYYREVAATIAARNARIAALARGDYDAAHVVNDAQAQRAGDRATHASAPQVVTTRLDGPPLARAPMLPPVWVAGPKDMEVGGIHAARPFRPSDWIAAETATAPLVHGAVPLEPFTPRLLLGRLFPQLADTVFCPFADTVAAIRRCPDEFLAALDADLRTLPVMHSFVHTTLALVRASFVRRTPGSTQPRYAVLLALLWRVDHAARIARSPPRRGSGSYWLQLFIDTHIDLALAMHTTGIYDDARLEDPLGNEHSIMESLLCANNPNDTRSIHSGDLPDVSGCLQYGSVWYRQDGRAHAGTIMEALVHLIVCKTQPHKCKVRNLSQILYEYACVHPQLMTILRAIITVSLLGNYAHAETRPDFATRLHVVYTMRPDVADDRVLFHWIMDNEGIVYGVLKEFYRYTVSLRPGFEITLMETTYWRTVSRAVQHGMDRVRAMLPLIVTGGTVTGRAPPQSGATTSTEVQAGDPVMYRACMVAASEYLGLMRERAELPMIHKLRRAPFSDTLAFEMTHYFNLKIMNPKIVRPQSSLTALAVSIGRDTAEFVLRAMSRVVHERVPRHRQSEPIELGWLAFFGVSHAGLSALRALAYDFELKDIADNAVTNRIANLYTRNPRDFHLIHIFFVLVQDWRGTQSFDLPRNYTDAQTAALHAKWKIPPWKTLPSSADTFYYCPACGRWLADVVDAEKPKSVGKMHSLGARHALYSDQTGRIYCGMQRVSVNTRKQVESGMYDELDREVPNVTEAKRARHFLQTPSCAATPAHAVHMLGRVQLLDGMLYALCMVCASLCPWDARQFGPNGFTCGFHGDDAPIIRTTRQEDAAVKRAKRQRSRVVASCSYCDEQLRPRRQYVRCSVIDDVDIPSTTGERSTPATYAYLRYTLCTLCGSAIHSPDAVRLRSRVDRVIHRLREWQRMREGSLTRTRRNGKG